MASQDVDTAAETARAVERLRLSEARLARRRQTDCGPSENARAAMRYVLERSDADESVTPTAIAQHLGVSTASVTGMLDRLRQGRLIAFAPHPDDRRSKLVIPLDRDTDLEDVDPLTARIRELAADLPVDARPHIERFLTLVREAVDDECT